MAASNVTIDLRGHTITGPGSGIYNGITDTGGPLQNIIVTTGTIKGFNEGILLGVTAFTTISKMNVMQNVNGMELDQVYNTVTDSQANNNGVGILFKGDHNTVTNSQANNNVDSGIVSDGNYNMVTNSPANNNGSDEQGGESERSSRSHDSPPVALRYVEKAQTAQIVANYHIRREPTH